LGYITLNTLNKNDIYQALIYFKEIKTNLKTGEKNLTKLRIAF